MVGTDVFLDRVAGMCSDEAEILKLCLGVPKGLESLNMVSRNHSERGGYLVPERAHSNSRLSTFAMSPRSSSGAQ
jgi:hypothetical protein